MNEHGETQDSQADLAAGAQTWQDWNSAVPGRDHPPEKAAELAARISVTPGRVAAGLARAETRLALHSPSPVRRDAELVQIHAEAGRFFQARMPGSWVPEYLTSRGFDAVLLPTSPWKIGYAPASWTALTDHLRYLGHCDAALLCSGLVTNGTSGQLRDRFHDRLMIPLRAEDGIVIAFIGRRHPAASDAHGPKYLNSPDTEMFTKGRLLAGLAEGRRSLQNGTQPVLVEGPLDAIAVSMAAPGRFAGVTACGTALTAEQVAVLARSVDLRERGVRVALDGDVAGRKASVRAYARLSWMTGKLTAVTLPDGRDPAELLEKEGRIGLRQVLSAGVRPLADVVVDARIEEWAHGRVLEFTEHQMGALRAAANVVATMPPDDVGPQAARLCALYTGDYGWSAEEVTREVIDAIERYYRPDTQTSPGRQRSDRGADTPQLDDLASRAVAPSRRRAASDRSEPTYQRMPIAARQIAAERD